MKPKFLPALTLATFLAVSVLQVGLGFAVPTDLPGGPKVTEIPLTTMPSNGPQKGPLFIQSRAPFLSPPNQGSFSPDQLEEIYHGVWELVANAYFDHAKLKGWEAWEHKFDGKLRSSDELEAAVEQMLGSLDDQWTKVFTTKSKIKSTQQLMSGIGHTGVALEKSDKGLWTIDWISYGTAAYHSPLRRGDVVISVQGKSLVNLTSEQIQELLKAPIGSTVEIEYRLADRSASVVRLQIIEPETPKVTSRLYPGGIAYVRFPDFEKPELVNDMMQAFADLREQNGGALKGIVLDLRGNPGGLFDLAVAVGSLFIENGTITTSQTRNNLIVVDQKYHTVAPLKHDYGQSSPESIQLYRELYTAPMVVLVDSSSASASEILSGALKDNGRATVIGVTTYGKGVGYSRHPLPTGGEFQITGLSYVTPNGTNLAHKGLTPNKVVERPRTGNTDTQLAAALKHLRDGK